MSLAHCRVTGQIVTRPQHGGSAHATLVNRAVSAHACPSQLTTEQTDRQTDRRGFKRKNRKVRKLADTLEKKNVLKQIEKEEGCWKCDGVVAGGAPGASATTGPHKT